MTEKIRFFIGTDVNGGCAECQMVLEYSIKKHCSIPYEIIWMKVSEFPDSYWNGWNTRAWSTPFSGFRYGIPEFCHYEGKAIYQDDDQLWLSDPLELWQMEIPYGKIMTGKRLANGEIRHCVSLWNNKAAQSILPPVSRRKGLLNFCDIMKQTTFPYTHIIGNEWNCYDGEDMKPENIKVLHFTDMSSNPGVKLAVERLGDQSRHWYDGPIIPHRRPDVIEIFEQYYEEALKDGFRVETYIPNHQIRIEKQSQSGYKANNGWGS